jgi:hypothetical protein
MKPGAKPSRKATARPEQALHRAVVALASQIRPAVPFFHVPNGGARSAVEGAIFKGLGVRAGVPDLVFVLPQGGVAFMEIKAERGRVSAAQALFRGEVADMGASWVMVDSLVKASWVLAEWYPAPRFHVPRIVA